MSETTQEPRPHAENTHITPETSQDRFNTELNKELELMNAMSGLYPERNGETEDSLAVLAKGLNERIANGDAALGNLVDIVEVQASAVETERTRAFIGDSPRVQLLLALRPMLRGDNAAEATSTTAYAPIAPEVSAPEPRTPQTARRVGHTVLVPGGVVQGKIVRGGYGREAEIQTPHGIVRSRDARLGNS